MRTPASLVWDSCTGVQASSRWANGYPAMCLPSLLLLATASSVAAQNGGSIATATVDLSNARGQQVNTTTRGSAQGFATVAVNGRSKPIGSTSSTTTSNATILDIITSLEPPMLNPVSSDPTTGVPAPSIVSPAEKPPAAGPESGAVLTRVHVFSGEARTSPGFMYLATVRTDTCYSFIPVHPTRVFS